MLLILQDVGQDVARDEKVAAARGYVDADGNKCKEKDVNIVYKSTEIIIAWEVSNHYE